MRRQPIVFLPFNRGGPVGAAFAECRQPLAWAAAFSAFVNILYLTPTIYMMQVYDRVVPAASGATLLLISLVGLVGIATLSLFDWVRGRLLVRVSARFERILAGPAISAAMSSARLSRTERAEAIREFDTLRQTLAGAAVLSIFDAPWAPVYLMAAFLLHPLLAVVILVAAGILLLLAWANERATHAPLVAANEAATIAYAKQGHITAYAEEVRAIGMREALTVKALDDRREANSLQIEASFAAGRYGAISKFVRLLFQSAALGVGAWLAINGSISMGAIIAASLLLTRALMPIEQIVGSWKSLLRARLAQERLEKLLGGEPIVERTHLPDLAGRVDVENLTICAVQSDRQVLSNISFAIAPGEAVGLVGLSGAGKSTLLRALSGSLAPTSGAVRYDGAAASDWDPERLGRSIGYLPQDFVLFPGTIKENISRFDRWRYVEPAQIDAAAIAAANAIGAHDMILRLPNGYDTMVGIGQMGLSAGQTQRIAIARALYGDPRLVLLDEPNAHLDSEATAALYETIGRLKSTGVTIILAAHSAEFLATCDRLLLVAGGRLAERPVTALEAVGAKSRRAS